MCSNSLISGGGWVSLPPLPGLDQTIVQEGCEGEVEGNSRRYIPGVWTSPHIIRRLTPTLGRKSKYQNSTNSTFIIRKVKQVLLPD